MKVNEIGSEFISVEINTETSFKLDNIYLYSSGRSSLNAIIKNITSDGLKHSAYFPSYCCGSMLEPFIKNGIEISFYEVSVNENGFYCDYQETNCDIVFLIDYFGFKNINQPSFRDKIIIKDVTHSLFRIENNFDFSYEFGSFRKWTAIDGGFALKKEGKLNSYESNNYSNEFVELRKKARSLKSRYLKGENIDKSEFLTLFNQAEDELDINYENTSFPQDEIQLLQNLDIEFIRNQRRANASVLIETLKSFNIPHIHIINKLSQNDCPLFVPIQVEKKYRNALKQYLVKQDIYTPIHWPLSELHNITDTAKTIYDEELSLICDQRYSQEDMYRQAETVNNFFKKDMLLY